MVYRIWYTVYGNMIIYFIYLFFKVASHCALCADKISAKEKQHKDREKRRKREKRKQREIGKIVETERKGQIGGGRKKEKLPRTASKMNRSEPKKAAS